MVVLDQVDALENFLKNGEGQLPVPCLWVKHVRAKPGSFVPVLSASSPNAVPWEYKYLRSVRLGLGLSRFSNEETKWKVGERFEDGAGKPSKNEIEHLINRTGNIPGNVASVLKVRGDNLSEMVHNWEAGVVAGVGQPIVDGYAETVLAVHREYRKRLEKGKGEKLPYLEHCVGCAVLRTPIGIRHSLFKDHRYMCDSWDHKDNNEFCHFCDPVARDAIMNCLREPLDVSGMVARPFLAGLN